MGDSYRPHGRAAQRRPPSRDRYDRFEPRDARDGYRPAPYDSDRNNRDATYSLPYGESGYSFRGAAGAAPRRPQDEFTYRAPGPPAPAFNRSSRNRSPIRHIPRGPRSDGPPNRKRARLEDNRRPRGASAKRFGRAMSNRELFRDRARSRTPEQLQGMNASSEPRFKIIDDLVDITDDSSSREPLGTIVEDEVNNVAPAQAPPSKWSNADQWAVLQDNEATTGPKVDLLQAIRRAKNDTANASITNQIADNDDFVSFNLTDDEAPKRTQTDRMSRNAPIVHSSDRQHIKFDEAPTMSSEQPAQMPSVPQFSSHAAPANAASGKNLAHDSSRKTSAPEKKRKRRTDDTDEITRELADARTPWFDPVITATIDLSLRLHMEICDFERYVAAQDFEHTVRLDLIQRTSVVLSHFDQYRAEGGQLHAFGSFASDLYLPDADMDLVALSPAFLNNGVPMLCAGPHQIKKAGRHIEKSGLARAGSLAIIPHARVPLIKWIDRMTGIKVDLSFENVSGIRAITTIAQWRAQFPAMPAIVKLIKQLLVMRGLTDVSVGGLGGFTIICLVVSMMQHMPEMQAGAMSGEQNYGEILMNFLELYGSRLDIFRTGITMDPPGYFEKGDPDHITGNPERLTIIDPNNAWNDVSGGSRNVLEALDCFRDHFFDLQRRLGEVYAGKQTLKSILGCVWSGDYSSFEQQRQICKRLYDSVVSNGGPRPLLPLPVLNEWHAPELVKRAIAKKRHGKRR